ARLAPAQIVQPCPTGRSSDLGADILVPTGSISGHKLEDADGSTSTTGDRSAVAGWTITLYNDANHNNTADAGEQVAQTTTDASGSGTAHVPTPGAHHTHKADP